MFGLKRTNTIITYLKLVEKSKFLKINNIVCQKPNILTINKNVNKMLISSFGSKIPGNVNRRDYLINPKKLKLLLKYSIFTLFVS
jgi:hypothetical protein